MRAELAAPENRRLAREKTAPIENARDRSLWRLNLDHSVVQPVLRPPAPPAAASSFRWRYRLWLRRHRTSDLRRQPCTPTRPVANSPARIGFMSSARPVRTNGLHRLFHASCRPRATIQLAPNVSPPAGPTTYLRLASDAVLWLGWRLHAACAVCCPCSPVWLPPPACTGCFHPTASPTVDRTACAARSTLRLSL